LFQVAVVEAHEEVEAVEPAAILHMQVKLSLEE
jgi:hypothetical protein